MNNIEIQHYAAQSDYDEFLLEFLDISWWHPIKKMRALSEAEEVRKSHKECCTWASENMGV